MLCVKNVLVALSNQGNMEVCKEIIIRGGNTQRRTHCIRGLIRNYDK